MRASDHGGARPPSHAAPSSNGDNKRARSPRAAVAALRIPRNTSARSFSPWFLPPLAAFVAPLLAKQKALRGAQDLQHLTGLADRDWPVLLFSYVRLLPRNAP